MSLSVSFEIALLPLLTGFPFPRGAVRRGGKAGVAPPSATAASHEQAITRHDLT